MSEDLDGGHSLGILDGDPGTDEGQGVDEDTVSDSYRTC